MVASNEPDERQSCRLLKHSLVISHMYSVDQLLRLVKDEKAEALKIQIGSPPVIVLHGQNHDLEGPAICAEDAEQLLQRVANSRHRRELRQRGAVQFIFRFQHSTDFVIRATLKDENVGIEIT